MPIIGRAASARLNWDENCAKCHGTDGNGKTKTGVNRRIKDFTDPKVQAEFSDTGMLKNLLMGIRTDGDSERMPAFKDKLTPTEAKELIVLIRSFKSAGQN